MDEDVREAIKKWRAPQPDPDFDRNMIGRFRRRRQPWWKRLARTRVSVPVPVLAASLALFTLAVPFWTRGDRTPNLSAWEPVAGPKLRVIRAESAR